MGAGMNPSIFRQLAAKVGLPRFSWNSSGGVDGLKAPGGTTLKALSAAMVAAYEAQHRENNMLGHYLEPRAGLTADGTPVFSMGGPNPEIDPADPAIRVIYPMVDNPTSGFLTLAQKRSAAKWIRGFSINAPASVRFNGAVRWSSIMGALASQGGTGNSANDPITGYAFNQGIVYTENFLDGDVIYWKMEGGTNFCVWVDDNLITGAGAAGTSVVYNAATMDYTTGTNGNIKMKFATSKRRKIKIAVMANGALCNLYIRASSSLRPACMAPITWVHVGDSFSEYTGAMAGSWRALTEYMYTAFGRAINFVNVAKGGAAISVGSTPEVPTASNATFRTMLRLHWGTELNPSIITGLLGKNDDASDQVALLAETKLFYAELQARYPNAIVVMFSTGAGCTSMATGRDVIVEATLAAAAAATNGYVTHVPLQSDPFGPLVTGLGCIFAPASGPLTLAANINNGTTGTLSTAWTGTTGVYMVAFTVATGFLPTRVTLTNGSTAMTAFSNAVTSSSTTCPDKRGNSDLFVGITPADALHPSTAGHPNYGKRMAQGLYEFFRANMLR